jgi:lysophospholipase L1-like esterase
VRNLRVWLSIAIVGGLGVFAGIGIAEPAPSPWMSPGNPTLKKTTDLPDNIAPSASNLDCDKVTSRIAGTNMTINDCVTRTALGLASSSGIVFTGASEMVPIVPPFPYGGLFPIFNQGMMYTYSNAPVVGQYLSFYTSVLDKLKPAAEFVNSRWQYTLDKNPDFTILGSDGKPVSVNPGTMAFSANGSWMIVDIPFQGFVRVNLATFDMVPFAPSLNSPGDYASYSAKLAVSNDGRYAAVRPGNAQEFRVYDIASCVGAVLPVSRDKVRCQSRDYWPYISSQLIGFRDIYQPRFMNNAQLGLYALYDFSPGKFKVGQFTLTAPGENPVGIEYLGMGDSFASGQGSFNYIHDTDTGNNGCHLSSLSYPFLLSSRLFASGHSVACSGARVKDINANPQVYRGQNAPGRTRVELEKMSLVTEIVSSYQPGYLLQSEFVDIYRPQTLTLSIGGNDIGFADIVKTCVMPAIRNTTCYSSNEDQQELVKRIQGIENNLKNTYRTVITPGRQVYIIGYPQIVVAGGNCAANVHLNEKEIKLFIDLTTTLNQTIKKAADAAGAQFVDVSNAFAGHRMCETKSSEVAINGFTAGNDDGPGKIKFIGAESYHPNALGHRLLEQAILGQTNNLKAPPTFAPFSAATLLPYGDAPKTGRPVKMTISDAGITPNVLTPSEGINVQVDPAAVMLKPLSTYNIKLDDEPANLGSIRTDAAGNLNVITGVPSTTSCGMHTFHIFGQNMANQDIDIFKAIYVDTGSGACSAGGPCGGMPAVGTDDDKDGLDDACDPLISDPPAPPTYSVYLTGSSIHIGSDGSSLPAASPALQMTGGPTPQNTLEAGAVAARVQQSRTSLLMLIVLLLTCMAGGHVYKSRAPYVSN